MEGVGVFFVIVVFVVIAIAVAAVQKQETNETYQKLAQRYGGTLEPGSFLGPPKVRFRHTGASVLVDICSTGGENSTVYTQVHFYGALPDVRCILYPEGAWTGIRKFMGMQDIEINSPHFDATYIIQGDDGAGLRDLLHAGVQQQVELLRLYLGNDDIYVSFTRHELLVKKKSFIKNPVELGHYVELAVGLYDQAASTARTGIEFVKATEPPRLKEAVCQICGEMIESDVVFCRRCKTPHHHDCWEYYGACSTYGCLEKKFMRPQSRRARRAEKTLQ